MLNDNFNDFKDDLIRQAELSHKNDYARWAYLCSELVLCLEQTSFAHSLNSCTLHLQQSATPPYLQGAPYDFATISDSGSLCLHVFDRNAIIRDEDELSSLEVHALVFPLNEFIKKISSGYGTTEEASSDNIHNVVIEFIRQKISGQVTDTEPLRLIIWTLSSQKKQKVKLSQKINQLTYEIEWHSLEDLWDSNVYIPDTGRVIEKLKEQSTSGEQPTKKDISVTSTASDKPQSQQNNLAPKQEEPPVTNEVQTISIEEPQDLIREIENSWRMSTGELQQAVAFERIAQIFSDSEIFFDIQYTGYRGPDKLALDAYCYDAGTDTLSLFYLDAPLFNPELLSEPLSTPEFNKYITSLQQFFLKSADGSLLRQGKVTHGCEEADISMRIRDRFISTNTLPYSKVNLIVLSLRKKGPRLHTADTVISDVKIPCHKILYDLDRLFELDTDDQKLIIDFTKPKFGGKRLHMLKTVDTPDGYRSYVGSIPAETLATIYSEFSQRILASNVRAFLQMTNSVNKGMLKTITTQPERFFAYNNGICLVASSITAEGSNEITFIQKAEDLQIVNGGQTTATLHYALRDRKCDISSIMVPVKLSVVPDGTNSISDRQEFVQKISEYANSQSKVTASDLGANTKFQVTFQRISQSVKNNIPTSAVPKYWFYERSRSSYKEEKRSGKEGKNFERIYPKENKFSKTDVAKWCKSWNCQPNIVSEGAQKCYVKFSCDLCEIEKNDPDWQKLDLATIQDTIAKGILFKHMDKLVASSEWYKEKKSYKANLVAYGLAYFSNTIRTKFGPEYDLNFARIWREQSIPKWMDFDLNRFAEAALRTFNRDDRPYDDVGEWVKKAKCWEYMLEGEYIELSWTNEQIEEWIVPRQHSIYSLLPAESKSIDEYF